MYDNIKEKVLVANLKLTEYKLVISTWGNVSLYDRENGVIGIKPSGLKYSEMTKKDIVIVDIDGNILDGKLKPSSDLETHLEIYRNFEEVNSICHTHSRNATCFAQAKKNIVCFGTTHADYFYGDIECTRSLSEKEVLIDYELNTGKVIVEHIGVKSNILKCPAILVANHGPFIFGSDEVECVDNAMYLEEIAGLARDTNAINSTAKSAPSYIQDKHYYRKHGDNAYYGQ